MKIDLKKINENGGLKMSTTTIRTQENELDKLNPNSLRITLGLILKTFFGGTALNFCEDRKAFPGRYRKLAKLENHHSDEDRLNRKKLHEKALSEIIHDRKHAAYWELEEISHSVGIPVGVLLSISRVVSLINDNKVHHARAFSHAIGNLGTKLDEIANSGEITEDDLKQIAKDFAVVNQNKDPELDV